MKVIEYLYLYSYYIFIIKCIQMASINDYLAQLQNLTQQNLEILQAINDSFFTKQDHLSVNISGQQFAMPSFISLENKINNLTANFNNLVHAPESGEAYFNMDGNSRAIEVRSYTQTPNSLTLPDIVDNFEVEKNHIFKDFLTPLPYLKFDIREIPNDITKVIVKKIIPLHEDLLTRFEDELTNTTIDAEGNPIETKITSKSYAYRSLATILKTSKYTEGKDYIEYDTIVDMPIRQNIGSGVYVIEKIVEDVTDLNLDNYITLKLRTDMADNSVYMNKLTYRLFDEVIEKPLRIGDILTTFEGNAKVQIYEIDSIKNTIKVKVLYGEYLNLTPSVTNDPANISSLSKLKFFSSIDFDKDKYIKIPLEEDNLIFISVAALNPRMNIQSPWGSGIMLRTHELKLDGQSQTFKEYYADNVRNIGDILYEISLLNDNSLTKQNPSYFKKLIDSKPDISSSSNNLHLQVIRINSHLDNSESIRTIRNLHVLKMQEKNKMEDLLASINALTEQIAAIPADDPDNTRASLESQLNTAQTNYSKALASYQSYIKQITSEVNNTDIPLDNAKFRIRGYFDYQKYLIDLGLAKYIDHVLSIQVQYRYKNSNKEYGQATSFDDKFIFSDWIQMQSIKRSKTTRYDDNSKTYVYQKQSNNDNLNEISWNQVEIPITQGETVDVRLRVMYDFGYPYAETYSSWSEIINVEFPQELYQQTQILDIIEENNNDIQRTHFENILTDVGVTRHINDKIATESQEIYFHNPKNIPSGFMTPERKIISLEDKLKEMQSVIDILSNEVLGAESNVEVSISTHSGRIKLNPFENVNVPIESYVTVVDYKTPSILPDENNAAELSWKRYPDYAYEQSNGKVSTVVNIEITNKNSRPVKLHSLFPGMERTTLELLKNPKFDTRDYYFPNHADKTTVSMGVFICNSNTGDLFLQTTNQYLTFRTTNPSTQQSYYGTTNTDTELSASGRFVKYDAVYPLNSGKVPEKTVLFMYPYVNNIDYLLVKQISNYDRYYELGANDTIYIPIMIEYYSDRTNEISKSISFDLYTSLYRDPVTYTFNITVAKDAKPLDSILLGQRYYSSNDRLAINMNNIS